MMLTLKRTLLASMTVGFALAGSAYAGPISFFGSPNTILTGTTPVAAETGTHNGVTIATATPGAIVQGSKPGYYAAPITDAAGTPYAGKYFSTGLTSNPSINGGYSVSPSSSGVIDFSFAKTQSYLGLLWGSVDGQPKHENVLSFYDNGSLIGSLTGAEVSAATGVPDSGVRTYGGSAYININVAGGFDQVVAGSQQVSFEFAAVTSSTQPISTPEPGSLVLLGAGLLGLGLWTRKRQKNA